MDSGKLVKVESMPVDGLYDQEQILALLERIARSPGLLERMMQCVDRMPDIERMVGRVEDRCRQTTVQCDTLEAICRGYLCSANVNYSQLTIDQTSGRNQVKLNVPVTGLGGDFVNSFPVPPGKKILLTHKPRPGFTPEHIRVDLNVAGGANNYSDFSLQFYLAPGGVNSELGFEIGNEYDGNLFLGKDGSQLKVDFPEYSNQPIDIGSLEKLAVVLANNGPANNLDSAHINVFYDNNRFYELCKRRCACSIPGAAV